MIRLTLRVPSTIPLELDGITPDRIANLSAIDVGKLPVFHGNRREPLGEFFQVEPGNRGKADIVFAGDTRNVKSIGAGMRSGFVFVENAAGMHAGAKMSGGSLVIDSGAGDWLGAEMTGGEIEVRGSSGHLVGAAYRGSRRGMSGGTILIRGNAGDEVGLLMRRGLIAVEGNLDAFAGASMIAGTIVVGGHVGERLGAGMKRGTLLISGSKPNLPPSFAFSCEYRPAFLGLLLRHLRKLEESLAQRFDVPTIRYYRGDRLTGGNGEVLVAPGSI